MASPNFAKKNPFMGMSVKDMKNYYDTKVRDKKLTLKEKQHLADQMQAAKKAAPKAKPKPSQSKTTPKSKLGADVLEMGGRNVKPVKKTGTYGQNMPSNPALKSQPKKPSRSSFPSGRAGASRFAEALRKYKAARPKPKKTQVKRNRRGRAI